MAVVDLVHGQVVGHDDPPEPPFPAQHVRQEPSVRGAGRPVHRVVGGHDAQRARLLDGRPEGRKTHLPQHSFGQFDGGAVPASVAHEVGGEMLEGAGDALALHPFHVGHGLAGDEVRIFAVGFLRASATNVARDVDRGGEDLAHTSRPRFAPDHDSHASHQAWIPHRGEAGGLRERGGTDGGETVQGFVMDEDGDPEPGVLLHEPLNGVDDPGGVAGFQVVHQACESADAVFADESLRFGRGETSLPVEKDL